MTPEQVQQKLKITIELEQFYEKSFQDFFNSIVYQLPDLYMVMTAAYGIDREQLAINTAQTVLERRLKKLSSAAHPLQMELFDESEL